MEFSELDEQTFGKDFPALLQGLKDQIAQGEHKAGTIVSHWYAECLHAATTPEQVELVEKVLS